MKKTIITAAALLLLVAVMSVFASANELDQALEMAIEAPNIVEIDQSAERIRDEEIRQEKAKFEKKASMQKSNSSSGEFTKEEKAMMDEQREQILAQEQALEEALSEVYGIIDIEVEDGYLYDDPDINREILEAVVQKIDEGNLSEDDELMLKMFLDYKKVLLTSDEMLKAEIYEILDLETTLYE